MSNSRDITSTSSDISEKTTVRPWVHFLAGGLGGTAGAVITCPLDVIKTRLQSSIYQNQKSTGVFQMLRSIYSNEGIQGLWRGLGPNLVGVVPARAIYFSTYASTKDYLVRLNSSDGPVETGRSVDTPAIHLISAVCAGIATSTSTNPIWLIKTRMQLQSDNMRNRTASTGSLALSGKSSGAHGRGGGESCTSRAARKISASAYSTSATTSTTLHYRNSFDCLVKIVRHEGFFSLFSGLSASYLGILEGTLQWVLYEQFKRVARRQRDKLNSNREESALSSKFSLSDTFVAAGAAKFLAAITTYPHEVLRTRLRQGETRTVLENGRAVLISRPKYRGMWHVISSIMRDEGFFAFYGGLTAHLLRTVPNAAIMFLCYESMVHLLEDQRNDNR